MLAFRKDALLAEYHGSVTRWQTVQAAALTGVALGVLGYLGGGLRLVALLVVLVMAGATVTAAEQWMREYEESFRDKLAALLGDVERLKAGGAP